MGMNSLIALRPAHQNISILTALILLGAGLVFMPFAGQASATGLSAGKYGDEQVFSTTGLVSGATCVVSGDTDRTFATTTVTRAGLANPVTMTNDRYVSFFESSNVSAPWGAKLFQSDGVELRLHEGDWISSTTSQGLAPPVSFDTLRVLATSGQIYALASEGFIYSSPDIGEVFVSNSGELPATLEYVPLAAANDCTSSQTIAKFTYTKDSYVSNPNPNTALAGVGPADDSVFVSSIGSFGVGQPMAPFALKTSGAASHSYAVTRASLPPGLSLDASTGVLSGTPTTAGTYDFDVAISINSSVVATKTYTGAVFANVTFDNSALRFGNGNQHSINNIGLFQQPFYWSAASSRFFQLTFRDYPLDMAIGTGTGGSNWSGTTVADLSSSSPISQQLDYREYVVGSSSGGTSKGYGKITVVTNFTINSQVVEVRHVYSLGQTDNFVKVVTTSTNKSASSISNMHVWVGTRDDYVGTSDRPTKLKGNLDGEGGSFRAITNAATEARALRITTAAEGALFYSTTPGTNMSMNSCCQFSRAFNTSPTTSPITATGDGSYAAVLPVGNLSVNASSSITWFYAAGAIQDLDNVARAVAAAAAPPAPTVVRGNTVANISWLAPEIEAGSTIQAYQYRYSTDGGVTWTTSAELPASPRTAEVTGLSNPTTYMFQVRAITQVGSDASTRTAGAWSSSTESEILGSPEAPGLTSVVGGDGTLEVTFTTPASLISPITSYDYCLNNCDVDSNWVSFMNNAEPPQPTIPSSPVTISTGVANGNSYGVRLRAVNTHGESIPSAAVTGVTRPTWTTTTLPTITRGASTNVSLVASANVTYAVTGGTLPSGLSLNASTGQITGTASAGGPYSFTVTATNSAGSIARTFTGAVTPYWVPTVTSIAANAGSAISQTIAASEITGLNLSSGATMSVTGLPEGVSFTVEDASTANVAPRLILGGAPVAPGTYTITVTVTDTGGATVTSSIEIVVGEARPSGRSGFVVTPTPPASPNANPRPSPRPTAPSLPSILQPRVAPTEDPAPAPVLGPIVLLPELERFPNAVFGPSNPIPDSLFDILARPLAYLVNAVGELELPTLSPSDSLAYENGSPVLVTLTLNDSNSGYVLDGDGWTVSLEATDSSGSPLTLDSSGNIILNRDRVVQFFGSGFAPGSKIKVWLFSDPAELATVTAGSDGTFSGSAVVPMGIPEGQHTVQLNGLTKDGQIRSVALGVVVEPIVVPVLPPLNLVPLWNFAMVVAAAVLLYFFILFGRKRWILLGAKRRKKKEEEELGLVPEPELVDPILAAQVADASPRQQFPVDSRRKLGKSGPPNKRGNFGFRPKNA